MTNTTQTSQAAASLLFARQMELETERAQVAPRGSRPNARQYAALGEALAEVRRQRQAALR
jgi:hypothetical protein